MEGVTVDALIPSRADTVLGVVTEAMIEGSMMLAKSEMDDDIIVTSVSIILSGPGKASTPPEGV